MSFADEVKTVTSSPAYKGMEQFNMEAPATEAPEAPAEEPALPGGQSQANPAIQATQAPKETSVKIGDKTFSSVQEAYIYAREEAAKAQGKLDAMSQMNKPQEVPEITEAWEAQMEKLMFTNPAEAIKQILAKAKSDTITEVAQQTASREAKIQRETIYENLMQTFLTENADLADFRSVIENVVLADPAFYASVEHLPWTESKVKIAEQTRKLLKIKAGAEAKTTILNSGAANMPGATGTPGQATSQVTSVPPMDFISQLRKANKRSK